MSYHRKRPLDYVDIAENLKEPAWYDLEDPDAFLLDDAADSILELLQEVENEARQKNMWADLANKRADGYRKMRDRAMKAEARAKKAEKELDAAIAEIERQMVQEVIAGGEPCDRCAKATHSPCEYCIPKWRSPERK